MKKVVWGSRFRERQQSPPPLANFIIFFIHISIHIYVFLTSLVPTCSLSSLSPPLYRRGYIFFWVPQIFYLILNSCNFLYPLVDVDCSFSLHKINSSKNWVVVFQPTIRVLLTKFVTHIYSNLLKRTKPTILVQWASSNYTSFLMSLFLH